MNRLQSGSPGSSRFAIIGTHPVQYFAPLFRLLAAGPELDLHVFYNWKGASGGAVHDPGFGQAMQWDVPLLEGYTHEFVPNRSSDPGTHHFGGLDNPELVDRVLAWNPDAVLVFGWAWKSHLRALRALHGRVPVLFRGDSTLLDEQPGPRRWARRLWLRWVYRHIDVALYVGTHNRSYFEAHGLRSEQLVWAPHAVENERFADPESLYAADASAWRDRLGIHDPASVFLFAGKLEPKKNPRVLLDSLLRLGSPHSHLVFAGSGPLEASLRARAAGDPRVHFLGFQNQSRMPVVYRIGDVIVLPSEQESWGLAVNEAMACGRPVIVTDKVGCAPDLVRNPSVGRVVQAGQVEALASAMDDLAMCPGLRTTMRAAASSAVQGWSLTRQADSIRRAVREVT